MSRWRAWAERLDDGLNPIVVKELRQAVHGHFLLGLLLAFPLIQLLILGAFLLGGVGSETNYSTDQGTTVFLTLQGLLLFVSMLFIPLYAGVRLGAERSGDNLDLLFVTTLEPRAIIAGKLLAAMVLVLLLHSVCLPFLALTYFLRGIDLPSIFVVVAAGLLVVVLCVMAAVLLACLLQNRALRVLVGLACVIQLLVGFGVLQTGLSWLLLSGVGSRLDQPEFWGWAGVAASCVAFLLAAMFVLAVAVISPPSSNRARPVRRFFLLVWLLSALLAAGVAVALRQSEPLELWLQAMAWVAGVGALVAVSGPDPPSRRVLREVPAGLLSRRWAFLTFSGAAGGLCWVLLVLLANLAAGGIAAELLPFGRFDLITATMRATSLGCYLLAYAVTAQLLVRRLHSRRFPPQLTWLVALLLMCFANVALLVVHLLFFFGNDAEQMLLLNPMAAAADSQLEVSLWLSVGWAAVVLVLNGSWLFARWRAFRPPPEPPDLPEADHG